MNRKYSIGFFIVVIVLISLFVYGFSFSYNRVSEKEQNEITQSEKDSYYYMKNKNGYVTVYDKDGRVYEYTSILEKDLPQHIQLKLQEGIQLNGLSEVYGFLENYSS